jgi:hypothetical protein
MLQVFLEIGGMDSELRYNHCTSNHEPKPFMYHLIPSLH